MAVYGWISTHQSSANLTIYIVRRFLMILRNKLRFARWATTSDIPVRMSHTTARWILPGDIPIDTTAITEVGTASIANTATWASYEATAQTYGNYQKISDLTDASWLPQAKNMISNIFAYAGAKTVDTLIRNDADGSSEFFIASRAGTSTETTQGGGTAGAGTTSLQATGDTMTAHDLAVLAGRFDVNDAEGFDEIGGDYALMVHGKPIKDMQTHIEPPGSTNAVKISWHDTMQRTVPGQRKLERYEVGTYAGISVQKTNNITTLITGSHSAYVNVALAKDAVGRANLDMRNVRLIVIPPGRPDKSDPLNLFGTIGWKARLAHRALDINNRAITFYSRV
jgi:N4-gp56 family major capsid protein